MAHAVILRDHSRSALLDSLPDLEQAERKAWNTYMLAATGVAHIAVAGAGAVTTPEFSEAVDIFESAYQAWREAAEPLGVPLTPWSPRTRELRRPSGVTDALAAVDQ